MTWGTFITVGAANLIIAGLLNAIAFTNLKVPDESACVSAHK